jgi:DNA-binding protein H-NS
MATTLESIAAKIEKLKAQADAIAAKQSEAAIANIRELMDKHGLTVADLDVVRNRKVARETTSLRTASVAGTKAGGAAKYRDPETGATWSGMGRRPAWIKNAADPDRFLVGTALSLSKSAEGAVKSKRRKSKLKGTHVAPKFRDPKTGATWTGRGLAPAWIKNVKDRSKFAIDGSSAIVSPAAADGAAKVVTISRAASTTAKRATAAKAGLKKASEKRRGSNGMTGRSAKAGKAGQASGAVDATAAIGALPQVE